VSPILLGFFKKMITQEKIVEWANTGLEDTDKYLVEVQVKTGNIITVFIDSDTSVTIDDCVRLSRFIESKLDRDREDFELRVSSFGADKPLKMKRQYKKNIGRTLKITLNDETVYSGKLMAADENCVTIKTEKNKKKNDGPDEVAIDFDNIKKAVVVLSFK